MLKESKDTTLEYQRLSKEEMETRGILGRLVGVCADFFSPTRNGRKYPESLWENVFNDPIMKERIENGVCYGELGHPTDREETDMEKIALCLAEVPKKGSDGKLRAVFDILNTPNGRILKSLCDYGSTIGISSRGSGDLETDFDGNESVNPDTYTCEGFDAVLIPAVKEARLQYVTESLNKTRYNKTLRDKLQESINKEDENNQKIMKESLNTLGIKLGEGGYNRVVYLNKPMNDGWEFSLSNKRAGSFEFNTIEELNDALKYHGLPQSLSKFNKSLYNRDNGYIKNSYQDWQVYAYPPTDYGDWVEEPSVEILNESRYTPPVDFTEDDLRIACDAIARRAKSYFGDQPYTTEGIIDIFSRINDDYDDYWSRGLRTAEDAKAFLNKLLNALKDYGIDNVIDNSFNEKIELNSNVNAKFNDTFDESLNESMRTDSMSGDVGALKLKAEELTGESINESDYYSYDEYIRDLITIVGSQEMGYGLGFDVNDVSVDDAGNYYATVSYGDPTYYESLKKINEALNTYPIEYSYTVEDDDRLEQFYGHINVKANSEEEAIQKAEKHLHSTEFENKHGISNINNIHIGDTEYINVDSLNEAAFGGYKYQYSVNVMDSNGRNRVLGGSNTVDDAVSIAVEQAKRIFENPWMSNSEKSSYISNMYIADDDAEHEIDTFFDVMADKILYMLNKQEAADTNSEVKENLAADNDGALVEELQKALRLNKKLDEKIIALQEKLSVGYAKEVKLNEQIEGYKTRIFKLSKSTNEVRALNEKLNTLNKNKETIDNRCNLLTESINKKNKSIKSLNESVKKQSETINELNIKLTESINQLNSKSNELSELVDKYETLNKDMNQLKESYSHKLERQNELVERYKNIAKKSVDKYIDTQATRLGIRTSEIKNRLPESYSFKDIDSICEDLQTYKLNMSNLPFSTNSILHEGMNIKASNVSQKTLVPMEEDIDELTLRLAGLK